jgi:hypothetical protein
MAAGLAASPAELPGPLQSPSYTPVAALGSRPEEGAFAEVMQSVSPSTAAMRARRCVVRRAASEPLARRWGSLEGQP